MDQAHAVDQLMAIAASIRRSGEAHRLDEVHLAPPTVAPEAPVAAQSAKPGHALGELKTSAGRDFSSALELIHEATEALRIAESRAEEMEAQLQDVAAQATDAIRHLKDEVAFRDDRIARGDALLRAAEARAEEAEALLAKFHDAVYSMVAPALKNDRRATSLAPPPLRLV